MECGTKCPYWRFDLRFPIGLGPVCKKYDLPLENARDKCFTVPGSERTEKKRVLAPKQTERILASTWPGINRGYGPVTRKLPFDE